MNDTAALVASVQEKLVGQVPLGQFMGLQITSYQPGTVVVSAPLAPNNLNTHGTAFGGSLYCVATMAGWSLVQLSLLADGHDPRVWVTRGEVVYHKPVTDTLEARAELSEQDVAEFLARFRRKGKARVKVPVTIAQQGEPALTLNVEFAALASELKQPGNGT